MKQVIQEVRSGRTYVRDVPEPAALPGTVLVSSVASVISPGTERTVVELARKSLLGKALERPDHVKRILQKVREEGWRSTAQQVLAKLDDPMTLGYSSAGIVLECGRGVQEFKPGDRVATASPHAAAAAVPRNLCALVPEGVSFEQAAYASLAAIALEGVRLTDAELGSRVLVVGLGLVGQLVVALLRAQGCRVFGADLSEPRLALAQQLGAERVGLGAPAEQVRAFSEGRGVDAVVITAATSSNGPIEFAAEVARVRGRIVLVGVVGLSLPRQPFFAQELSFTVSSSLGPGRGDPVYEERGQDYPFGHVRWTAQRNMETALALMANGGLPVERLTTHRFEVERAAEIYELITAGSEPFLGVVLQYPREERRRTLPLKAAASTADRLGISLAGPGNFARLILLPRLQQMRGIELRGVCSSGGLSAVQAARRGDFAFATTEWGQLLSDSGTRAVVIATRHDLHAPQVVDALRAGKAVYVEKPLCLTLGELSDVVAAVEELGASCPPLTVGFNRRFAAGTTRLRTLFEGVRPLAIGYRFAAPPLPAEHWTQDETVGGGRLVGECCHAIDLCIALTGSRPVRVFAESVGQAGQVTDDRVVVTLRHADGSLSCVSYQTGGDRAAAGERIEVMGGGRTAVLDAWDRLEWWSGGKARRERLGKDRGYASELAAFVRACRDGEWPIPWDQLVAGAWATLAAVRSLREGYPIMAPDA